ncbi:hypothetical protein BGZ68_006673 [Mortierella alpina]|nr:hypothetical protein BGZ68_006673 [Mortierella alpina]
MDSNTLHSIAYSSDDFLSDVSGVPGDLASLYPRDELETPLEWEVIELPEVGPQGLVLIRSSKTQQYLSLESNPGHHSPNDKVILDENRQQRWVLQETEKEGQYFIQLPQEDDGGVDLVMDAIWADDQLTVALQPKKDQEQTWTIQDK